MKRLLVLFMAMVLIFSLVACGEEEQKDGMYAIDYNDAVSFENALNDGTKVKGKIVQFYVEEYVPNSILGINCHAGEHLNFLFNNELDVETGDTIVVEVTEEPSKVFLLGSWKVPCEFLGFDKADTEDRSDAIVDSNTESATNNSSEATTTPATEITTEPTTKPATEPTTAPTTEPPHTHSFSSATCTAPKTCACGATEGEANGHNWKDATCSDPKTCTVCGTTSGLTAGHNFSDGKCITCGKADPDYHHETMVWIPTHGGTKYHTRAGCSNMEDPKQVTQSEAESQGITPCIRCH